MLNDPLANMFSKILNYEKVGKPTCIITPVSNIIKKSLEVLQDNKYLGSYEQTSESRGGTLKVNLLGSINKCGVIKPRFDVKLKDFEKFEKRYLPGKSMGIIIISTAKGIMTLDQAREQRMGGKLVAYCY
jgi:small subunit ribosomal protein S8